MIPMYETKTFKQIWDSVDDFKADLALNPTLTGVITSTNQSTLYCLLYAKYGNTPIANLDENQFKAKIYTIIFQYGGTWQKKLDIQASLRALTDDEIMQGTKVITNHAMNPATEPATGELEELDYIDAQNTTNYKKGAIEAYSELWAMLDDNITELFIERFAVCFKQFVRPDASYIYISEEGDEL